MKIVQLITRRGKWTAQRIVKLFYCWFIVLKNAKKLRLVELITKRKRLSAQQITKLFKGFLQLLLKSVKEIENSSGDY